MERRIRQKKMASIGKKIAEILVFLLANTGGGCRRIHNERSDFAANILRQSFREMTMEVNKKKNCVDRLKTDDLAMF